jgi:hypothetical protein
MQRAICHGTLCAGLGVMDSFYKAYFASLLAAAGQPNVRLFSVPPLFLLSSSLFLLSSSSLPLSSSSLPLSPSSLPLSSSTLPLSSSSLPLSSSTLLHSQRLTFPPHPFKHKTPVYLRWKGTPEVTPLYFSMHTPDLYR